KQYAWGYNSNYMIGGNNNHTEYNPMFMPGSSTNENGLNKEDNIIAVETGGHTTINIRECTQKFGYVGHRINGSMGNGETTESTPNKYTYSTGVVNICGAQTSPSVKSQLKICEGEKADLSTSIIGS